jgi:hypothetical protein
VRLTGRLTSDVEADPSDDGLDEALIIASRQPPRSNICSIVVGVSANPPKNDAWPPWRDVRFVLIRSVGKLRPCRGLVIDWKREGRAWQALVVYYDDAALKPVVKMDWLARTDLIPVPIDPNWRPESA